MFDWWEPHYIWWVAITVFILVSGLVGDKNGWQQDNCVGSGYTKYCD